MLFRITAHEGGHPTGSHIPPEIKPGSAIRSVSAGPSEEDAGGGWGGVAGRDGRRKGGCKLGRRIGRMLRSMLVKMR
eukprot:3587598-Rhodomonas_salina.1